MSVYEFPLADVGEGIAEAEIIEWRIAVGDTVTVDQVVAVIETDKSQIEMPVPVAGTVLSLGGAPGEVVRVGATLLTVETAAAHPHPDHGASLASTATRPVAGQPIAAQVSAQSAVGRVLASPSTRKLAAAMGVDLATVVGTGPHGRVTREDVLAHKAGRTHEAKGAQGAGGAPTPAPSHTAVTPPAGSVTVVPLQGVRRAIAASMTAALQVPHILEFKEIDATALLAARDRLVAATGSKQSITPLLIRACVVALQQHPRMNARFDPDAGQISEYGSQHIGIATATDDGLIVPVLHDAQAISVTELPSRIDALTSAAKNRTATSSDLQGGTFTVTNFGSFGTWLGTPIIRTPEVAIAGFGRVTDKVLAVSGQAAVRPVLPIVIAVDHRVNDGAHLGAFTATLAHLLTYPAEMGA